MTIISGRSGAASREVRMAAVRARIASCTGCATVDPDAVAGLPGYGSLTARVVLVGESPASKWPHADRPFAGGSGRLIDAALYRAGRDRAEVFITNAVHCRLPGNRDPKPREIANHLPLLRDELEVIAPRLVIGLGRFAAQALRTIYPGATEVPWSLRTSDGGRAQRPPGAQSPRLLCAPHPAYVMRFRHAEEPRYVRRLAAALLWVSRMS